MSKTLEHLDPATLTVGGNVRTDTRLDAAFLASVKERGVLEPVLAHRDADGQVVVDQGQRRTLAATQLGLLTIPVIVDGQQPQEADRLVDQWVENEHRAALTNKERIQAVEQMALVGLTAGQIAKRTATSKTDVAAAMTAAASQTAVDHADELTLEDAALLAEFEDDAKAVNQLLQEAKWGRGLAARAQRIRDDREELRVLTAAGAALADQGLTVIEAPGWGDKKTLPLDRLRDGRRKVDPEKHAAGCPGHVVWVERSYEWDDNDQQTLQAATVPGCTGWAKHGHTDVHGSSAATALSASDDPADKEKARVARRHVIESNKDWKAATTVRRRWLAEFGSLKAAPSGAEALIAAAIVGGWRSDVSPYAGTSGSLGLLNTSKEALDAQLATATPKRALQIALALTVASWEAGASDDLWRATDSRRDVAVRVLEAISQWGHQLSDIEERIIVGTAAEPQAVAA